VCPACGHTEKHIQGQPCNQRKCPKCETRMIRQ
jgi:transposase